MNLGLRPKVIDNIGQDCMEQRRRFEMILEKWQMQEGDKATWGVLELAITNANRADLSYKRLEEGIVFDWFGMQVHKFIPVVLSLFQDITITINA